MPHLVARGLLDLAEVLDRGVIVRDVSRRNRTFHVQQASGPELFVKQRGHPEEEDALTREAAVHMALGGRGGALSGALARVADWDGENGVLATERLPGEVGDARLWTSGRLAPGLAAALGARLAALHASTVALPAGDDRAPWALRIHRPRLSALTELSAAELELTRILQRTPGFGDALDAVGDEWAASALCHNDLRWDNVVIGSGDDVQLIDWELAGRGDPAWDLGSAIASSITPWIHERPPGLSATRPAFHAMLARYAIDTGLTARRAARLARRAVRMAAARLVQEAFETASLLDAPTPECLVRLQVAHNVLMDPRGATRRLVGMA